jgi:outer membrane lipoprotein carrier protein
MKTKYIHLLLLPCYLCLLFGNITSAYATPQKNILNTNRISGLAQIDPSSLEFPLGGKERATGLYSYIHEDCERRSQQRGKPKCEGYTELESLLNNLHTMSADFTQNIEGTPSNNSQAQNSTQPTTGKMALQKPGKFRWEVKQPNKQLIIADGRYVWIYDIDLEQATQQKIDYSNPNNPAMLLTGSTKTLHNFFQVKKLKVTNENGWYELKPKKNGTYQKIKLHFVDNKLVNMFIADNLGQNSDFHFSNVKINSSLEEKEIKTLFTFSAPKGVDIIHNSP